MGLGLPQQNSVQQALLFPGASSFMYGNHMGGNGGAARLNSIQRIGSNLGAGDMNPPSYLPGSIPPRQDSNVQININFSGGGGGGKQSQSPQKRTDKGATPKITEPASIKA